MGVGVVLGGVVGAGLLDLSLMVLSSADDDEAAPIGCASKAAGTCLDERRLWVGSLRGCPLSVSDIDGVAG